MSKVSPELLTDADRVAAGACARYFGHDFTAVEIETGEADNCSLLAIVTRHRIDGQEEMRWQPIETAPEGVSVLVVEAAKPNHPYLWKERYRAVHEATFEDGEWLTAGLEPLENEFFEVALWRPMPEPPAALHTPEEKA